MKDRPIPRVMPSGMSPSSIELWLQCQRRFEKEKVEGRASFSGVDAVLGTYVHRCLELLMERPPGERTIKTAYLMTSVAWPDTESSDDFAALELSDADIVEFRRRAIASVRTYFKIEDPRKIDVVGTERWMQATVDGVPLRGVIDRLERDARGGLVVTDYKSGKVPIPRFRGPKLRQLNLYAALVEAVDGELPTTGRLVFTTYGQEVVSRTSRRSVDEAVGVASSSWSALNTAYKTGVFEPNPGPLCGWCPFAAECPEGIAEISERAATGKLKKHAPNYHLATADAGVSGGGSSVVAS